MAVQGAGKGGGGSGGGKGIRAGRAYVELSANDAGLRSALAKARAMVMKFGKGLAGVGGGLLGAGGGILGAGALGVKSLLERAGELGKLSQKLGVPVEQLSAFSYAAETTGQSLDDLSGHFENLAERVAQGANGAGEAAETFKKLGIDAGQLKLQNPVDQLITIADAMANVTNETERLGMLSSLGGDQFQNLNALFKKGGGGIRELMGEAGNVGATMTSDTAKKSQEASNAFLRAWTAIKSVVYSVAEAFLEHIDTIKQVASWIVLAAKNVRNFVSENKQLVGIVAAVVAGITAVGGILLTVGLGLAAAATAVSGLVAGFSALASVVGAVFSPIGLAVGAVVVAIAGVVAGLVALVDMFTKYTETGRTLAAGFMMGWREIVSVFREAWGGIVDALKAGDMKLAWKIATAGITVLWKETMLGLQAAWNKFKDFVVDGAFEMKRQLQLILPDVVSGTREEIDKAAAENLEARRAAREADKQAALAEVAKAKEELTALVAQAAAKANAPAPGAVGGGGSGSAMARLLGGSRGTFSAPNYSQFFGASGIEQKQLQAQLRAANALDQLNKKAGPLVFQ